MPVDSGIKKTVTVALGVCLVCSVFVSAAAIGLKALQEKNKKLDRITNILQAGDLSYNGENPAEVFNKKIKPVIVELKSGLVLNENELAPELMPENFNLKTISSESNFSSEIPLAQDIAGIKRKPNFMIVYEVKDKEDNTEKYIMPIYGKGLWSTLYGFIAIDRDLETIKGITFYEHGETPGLGGEVDNPRWKETWKGKKAFDENGNVIIDVIKGAVDPSDPRSNHQIDGLSGATITTRGVDKLIEFWLGENGYRPFLNKLREEGKHEKV